MDRHSEWLHCCKQLFDVQDSIKEYFKDIKIEDDINACIKIQDDVIMPLDKALTRLLCDYEPEISKPQQHKSRIKICSINGNILNNK